MSFLKKLFWHKCFFALLALAVLFTFTSCNPDDDDDGDSGEKTYTVYTANTTILNYNNKLGGSDYNLEEGYYIIFYKGDNYQSDAETIKSMFYWSQSTQTESQLRTNFNDWGIKSEHITSFLDGTVYGFAIAQSSDYAYLIFVFPSSTGANSSGSSGSNSGSSGTSGSSGSGTTDIIPEGSGTGGSSSSGSNSGGSGTSGSGGSSGSGSSGSGGSGTGGSSGSGSNSGGSGTSGTGGSNSTGTGGTGNSGVSGSNDTGTGSSSTTGIITGGISGAYCPTFSAGTVLEETEEYVGYSNSTTEGLRFFTHKHYYSFASSSYIVLYTYENGFVDYNASNYFSYNSSTGALYWSSNPTSYYIYRIEGNYYKVQPFKIPSTSGSGLNSTFSYSSSTEYYSSSWSLSLSSNGKWTMTVYSKDSSTGEYESKSGSGTYTASNGIIYFTGNNYWEVYKKSYLTGNKEKISTTETFSNAALFYYDGSTIRGVDLLTYSSLPSTSRSFSDTPKAEAHFQQSKLKLK